jgi:transposase
MAERRFKVLEFSPEERKSFLERIGPGQVLSEDDSRFIEAIVTGVSELVDFIQRKDTTLRRLRHALFGGRTEKTANVFADSLPSEQSTPLPPKRRARGHGRHPARRYRGAQTVSVPHPHLCSGQLCPDCQHARLYHLPPSPILRLVGQAPVNATRFDLTRLRCASCGTVFTAPAPPEAGSTKYDQSVGVVIALMRFGSGMPMYRLARLQASLGVPLPASVQWELAAALAEVTQPVLECLIRHAAQRQVIHNDDTPMRVTSLRREARSARR